MKKLHSNNIINKNDEKNENKIINIIDEKKIINEDDDENNVISFRTLLVNPSFCGKTRLLKNKK